MKNICFDSAHPLLLSYQELPYRCKALIRSHYGIPRTDNSEAYHKQKEMDIEVKTCTSDKILQLQRQSFKKPNK